MAQSVGHLTSAQVMISQSTSSSPVSGSVLTAQSLEPLWILCLPLSALPLLALCLSVCLSLSLSRINKLLKKKKNLRGTWVAQSVGHLTSAQVMISWSVGLSPTPGSVLTAQNLEPV